MTFCSPFLPTAVASSRQRQEERAEGDRDASRETDKTEEGEMMRRERRDERLLTRTFASAYYFYPLPFNCCCCILSLLPLPSPPRNPCPRFFLPPSLSTEADTGRAPPAGSSEVCGGGLAVPNEVPSVRFQTSTASLAFSSAGAKWWTGRG